MIDIEQDKILGARRRLYTTVFAQCFSPCGRHLVTATNFGLISVFSLPSALSPEANEESWKPFLSFKGQEGAIYSLISTDKHLISAGACGVQGWQWTDVLAKSPRISFSLTVPSVDRFAQPETNAMAITQQDSEEQLITGCGDNKLHLWDLQTGSCVRSMEGHSDYIHDVTMRSNGAECVSASEDGTVRIWDTRIKGEAVHLIEPNKNEEFARPDVGRWISCVAVDKADDWMVCGGAPKMCLWHLRSLAATTVFDTPGATANCVTFHEDSIISASTEPFAEHWSVNGEKRARVPCTPTSVYSIAVNERQPNTKILSIAGDSHKIDICTNFGYTAFSMAVC